MFPPSPVGGVSFQADTDNRKNFPNDRSFQLFKKQRYMDFCFNFDKYLVKPSGHGLSAEFLVNRIHVMCVKTSLSFHRDQFYELLRDWEENHLTSGWSLNEALGDRIRNLVGSKIDMANHIHFTRLFQSQLIQVYNRAIRILKSLYFIHTTWKTLHYANISLSFKSMLK